MGSVGKGTVIPCTETTTTAEGTALDIPDSTRTAEKGRIRTVGVLSISVEYIEMKLHHFLQPHNKDRQPFNCFSYFSQSWQRKQKLI